MKPEIINRARAMSIVEILSSLGLSPERVANGCYWYCSPMRPESVPSFKVHIARNQWYDFGEQIGGNAIDLVMRIKGVDFRNAIEFLIGLPADKSFSFDRPPFDSKEASPQITKVVDIVHPALIEYLDSRGIAPDIYKYYCRQVHYIVHGKKYFAIGFKNASDGYELRNKFFKGCIGAKNITSFRASHKSIAIFEGFIDFLSHLMICGRSIYSDTDVVVLNSVGNTSKINDILPEYEAINLYLDNDAAGSRAIEQIKLVAPHASDCRSSFAPCKDINEHLLQSRYK